MMHRNIIKNLLIASIFLVSYMGISQEYTSFTRTYPNGDTFRYQNNIKGDLTFIANNIVNRDGGTSTTEPEDPYDETGGSSTYNDWLNQQYIDIDADPTTFSSSSANFAFPQASCNLIRYAGLYWSATYPSEQAGQSVGTGRQTDFNQVKLMVPGGAYVDVTADEVLFDGYTSTDSSIQENSPYACYADVTALITPLADPTGTYTIANIRSVVGSLSPGGGAAGGWTLVVVYENPTLSGKLITTFDGFARVRSANPTVDIDYSGFNTIPVGPVNANIGVAALEGDNRITGDQLQIKAASSASFTTIDNAANPSDNFFNSNITLDGVITTNRTPNSVNTLGYDTDIFLLNNPSNSVIPNDETAATFRFTSTGDQYYPFFNSFNVEIIEPNIVLEKKVEDIAGNDITGLGVNLGQLLDYVLSFQNIGNDDGDNYTIRDVLPINVTLDEANLVLPAGVTYTYDVLTRTVVFSIPNNLIEENDPVYSIRMRVQVAENCFDFIDACTDLIENLAYSTYQGVINDNQITDDPSVSDFDTCGFITPGATNFLLDDLSDCDFTRTVQLCGDDVLLDAGDNFDDYIWYKDENGDNLIDVGDTVLNDGDSDNDLSTLLVNTTGTYIVDKIVADPCKGFQEIIIVERFGDNTVNPIIDFYNTVNGDADPTNDIQGEIVSCSIDGDLLPKIFLCGINDSELLQVNIVDAQSIVWEQLDEASCASSGDDCANKDLTCTWNQVTTGNTYDVNAPGKYRLVVTYQNGCFNRFYFNVFQNTLDIQYNKTDIVCTTLGNITITNLGAGYGYQLVDTATENILVPFSSNNGSSFDIATNGAYRVEVVQLDALGDPIDGACVFSTPDIGVLDKDFQVNVTPTAINCNGLGSINIQVLNVNPGYEYELRLDDGSNGGLGTLLDNETAQPDNNFTFNNLNAGNYIAIARTDDGCFYSEQVAIIDEDNLYLDARVSQHITCKEGNILMDSGGGKTPHTYAVWSFIDDAGVTVTSYPTPNDIPASAYQTSQIFDILNPGDYTFVVVDRNNCYAISNTVTIEFRPAAEFNATSVIDVLCFGDSTGAIQFNLVDDNGYQLTYYLFDATTFDENNYDYVNALATNASGNFPGLPTGDYAIVITQRKGSAECDYFEYHTISAPTNAISANAILIQDYTCVQLGIIEAQNVTGGTSPYEYSIDGVNFVGPGAGAETFTNLTDGTYSITVRDANGCTFGTNPVTIAPRNEPSDLTFVSTQPVCPALTSDVTVKVVDGTAPYVFEIIAPVANALNNGNNSTFAGLSPGTYTFQVTDDKGCTYSEDYAISNIVPINVVGQLISNVTCFADTNGEALYTVSGFNTSYDYTITGPSNFNGTAETNSALPLTNLDDGTYAITVTDTDTNCAATTSVTIQAPTSALTLSANETQPTCTVDGSVILTATGGWGSNNFSVTYPDGITWAANTTGFFTGLTQSGTYNVSVTDANGCVATDSFNLNAAVAPVLEIVPNAPCYDDLTGLTLTANVLSGGDGNFQYSLNGGVFGAANVFAGLTPGTHTITVRDGKDCSDTETITIDPELSVIATASTIEACGTDADITITAGGGDGNYVYAVVSDGVVPISGDFSTTNPTTVTGAGDYDIYVRDNNGNIGFCEASYDLTVVQDAPLAITPTFTPVICFGEANGSISIVASGGFGPYEYSINNGTTYQTTGSFVNLTAGTYNLRIRDANNCEASTSITVTQPDQLVAEAALTQNYTCLLLGQITVGGIAPTSGGSGDYQYRLNNGTWTTPTTGGTIFTNLTGGTYSIDVRDANETSCNLTLPDIVIAALPTEPVLATSVVYSCDGTGTITVLPNDPSYSYSIDGGLTQASNIFSNINIGLHTITVDYGSDCTIDTVVNVEDGHVFGSSITNFTHISCNSLADGSITFQVENFDTINGFEYSVNGGAFSAPQTASPITINALPAAVYSIEVRDVMDNTCSITLNATLTEPAALIATAAITEVFTCNNTGAIITANAVGGTPSYEYQLEDNVGGIITAYQTSNTFTNVPAGDYIVRARDTNNCDDPIDTVITVVAPSNPTFTATPTACYSGNNDGTIQVDITSLPGNGGFQFSLNSGPWMTPTPTTATTYTFSNLSSGVYTIDVKDQYGCAGIQQNVTINPSLTASALLNNDLTCLMDATITITANGGSGIYTYEWSDDAGTTYASSNFVGNVFSASSAGTYIFMVTDTTAPTACSVITNQIVVTPTEQPVITNVTPTHILCNGDSTGTLDITIDTSVGLAPYTIQVVETVSSTNYGSQTTGLPSGNYEVTITDDKGCVSNPFSVSINQPNALAYDINLIPITCNPMTGTNPGSITVENLTGGTAEYTYYLSGNNGYSSSYATTAGGENHTFSILEFGIYQVDVVDANGCSFTTTNIIASPPDDLDIDVSTLTASCAVGGTAIVTVSSAVGSGNYEFAILETYAAPYSSGYQAADGGTPDTSTFTSLTPGITYTFVVHDLTTDCYYFETAAAPIDSPTSMAVTSLIESNITCTGSADGNVTFTFDNYDVTATDVTYEIFNAQSNVTTGFSGSASVNPPTGAITISNFATLGQGVYYILLAEVGGAFNGCSISSPNFTITESTNLLAVTAASPKNDNCNLNAGIITAVGQYGTAPYEYQYLLSTDPAPTAASPGWTTSTTTNVESGDYIVYIKDANNCIQNDAITVNLDPSPQISLAIVDECVDEGAFEVIITLDQAGIAPYSLSVNGGAFQNIIFNGSNQYTVSGLSSGAGQTIEVRDLNGCGETDTFDIITPLEFNVLQTALLDCEPGVAAYAEITIEVTSGSGGYEYEIDGPGLVDQARTSLTSNPFTWLGAAAAGSYAVTVYDINTAAPNCFETITIDIPDAVVPDFTESHTDITCNGANDGTITLYPVDNGISPLTFVLTPMPAGVVLNGNTFENVPPGTYSVRGTGTNDCFTDIFNVVINEPNPISIPAPTVVEFSCTSGNTSNNASISINAAGITGGSSTYVIYEFINDQGTAPTGDDVVVQSGTNTTYVETNVVGGSYTINVYDDNGCLGTTTAIILPYDELLTATAAITSPISCNPGNDGEITITVTSTANDTAKFEYSNDNGASYQASNVFPGLGIGTHNFLVRHTDTGCIITVSETLTDPNTFTIDVNKLSDIICYGSTTGEVTFELLDATYPGGFDWEVFDTNGTPINLADDVSVTSGTEATNGPTTVVNLPAGNYYVSITQTNNPLCANTEPFFINGPTAAITASVQIDPISCVGNDGAIEIIDVLGGWGGYSYYVGTLAPTGPGDYVAGTRFSPLSAGTYEAWVMDSSGCEQMVQNNIVLVDPTPITATLQVNQENCINLQGEIEVVGVSGGQGTNYTYQLIKDGVDFGAPQNTTVFSGLGAGTYEVRINDQWSCTFTTTAELLYEEINATTTVVKPIDCTVNPGGAITINTNGGSANLEFTVTFPDLVTTITNNTGVFTALTQPGAYSFLVTDLDTATPCTVLIVETLDDKVDPILLNATIVDVSCFGGSDGSITANLDPATALNPPYQYELIGLAGAPSMPLQNSPLFDGLPLGDYQIRVVSDRGCETTKNETITEPTQLVVTASATAFACAPDNSVNVSVLTVDIPTTGTAPYLYSLDNINFQTSNTFAIIDNGAVQNLMAYVRDANGCTANDTVILQPINTFTANVTQVATISCSGPEEILITVTDDGNPHTYTYELLPVGNPNGTQTSTSGNTANYELSAVGSYTFRITDTAIGCYIDTVPYDIAPYDLIDVVALATTPVTCFGDTNGALEVNISNYAGTYDYEVFTQAGASVLTGSANTSTNPLSITGLSGGNYFVRITETAYPECSEDSNIITIASPDMLLTTIVNVLAEPTCTDDQGEILVDPSGGYAPYDIVLTNTTTSQVYNVSDVQAMLFTGLSAGNYDIVITDNGGCILNDNAVLVAATPIVANAIPLITNLACYDDDNGTVTAIVTGGGSGSYEYQLNFYDNSGSVLEFTSGEQTSDTFIGLGAGIYSITVTDGWNCDVETNQVTITEPTIVEAYLIRTDPLTCATGVEFELTATGGSGTYEYSLDNVIFMPMTSNPMDLPEAGTLGAGTHQYYVRDAINGCDAIVSNSITEDPIDPLVLTIDQSAAFINCNGDATATIYASAQGGLGNYQYELYANSVFPANRIAGPQSLGEFSGLAAGTYWVNVISEDCVTAPQEVIITEPVPLTYTDNVVDVSCFGEGNGSITISLSGGSGGYQYAISPNLNQFDTVNTFTDLTPGDYTIIAQDMNGCFELLQYTITEPELLDLSATSTPEICIGEENGTISVNISGGTAPYSTSLNDRNDFVQDRVDFTDLAAGNYLLFVIDAQGCETNTVVEVLPGQNLNATVEPIYECTGNTPNNYLLVTLEDPAVANDIMYALDSNDPADMQLTSDFTNIAPGTHSLTIAHANGCVNTVDFEILGFEPLTLELQNNSINEITAIATGGREKYTFYFNDDDNGPDNTYIINHTDTYEVRVVDENGCEVIAMIEMEFIDIEIPNFFTPDGDGNNDSWLPLNIEPYPEILIKIYDRYGRVVEENVVDKDGWDGKYHGADLPTGDYWYVIKLQGENDDREFVGHFTLYR